MKTIIRYKKYNGGFGTIVTEGKINFADATNTLINMGIEEKSIRKIDGIEFCPTNNDTIKEVIEVKPEIKTDNRPYTISNSMCKADKIYSDDKTKEEARVLKMFMKEHFPIKNGSIKQMRKEERLKGCFVTMGATKYYIDTLEGYSLYNYVIENSCFFFSKKVKEYVKKKQLTRITQDITLYKDTKTAYEALKQELGL